MSMSTEDRRLQRLIRVPVAILCCMVGRAFSQCGVSSCLAQPASPTDHWLYNTIGSRVLLERIALPSIHKVQQFIQSCWEQLIS
jgi:hypothetical protein